MLYWITVRSNESSKTVQCWCLSMLSIDIFYLKWYFCDWPRPEMFVSKKWYGQLFLKVFQCLINDLTGKGSIHTAHGIMMQDLQEDQPEDNIPKTVPQTRIVTCRYALYVWLPNTWDMNNAVEFWWCSIIVTFTLLWRLVHGVIFKSVSIHSGTEQKTFKSWS